MTGVCHQANFQRQFGGGEVYTAFVARALQELGWRSRLFIHPEARFWSGLDLGATELVPAAGHGDIPRHLGADGPLLVHAPGDKARALTGHGLAVACFAHMPPQGRKAASYAGFDRVLPVSEYVRQGLLDAGISNVHDEALYGVADLNRPVSNGPLRRGPLFDWDRRKGRDRLLGATEFLWGRLLAQPEYRKQPGVLTLAIVSRITTIKQFPLLFSILAPILARHKDVRLEIFGSGGYASMRDLRRALAPVADRVGWWGYQRDVASIYRNVDYVLTGLPEREALGLNVIEAQACGTPVLAVDAPPFTETVVDGAGGHLYRDPRQDQGAAFSALLERITNPATRPDPLAAANAAQLVRFSADAFRTRLGRVLEYLCP